VTTTSRTYVGESVLRVEDEALLRGQGRFMDDIDPVPHARHAAIVRSPYAHARIGAINAGAALAAPGVIAVLTAAEYLADGHRPIAHVPNPADAVE
jgi:aerobic carbon-monoxide dehydrogenase large subunit